MAIWWVSSATGANSANGTAYTTPKKYLWLNDGTDGLFIGAIKPAAGDTVYVLDGHSELSTLTTGINLTGGFDNKVKIINVASFNSGSPNTLGAADGCVVGFTAIGAGRDIFLKNGLYIYGFHFDAGDQVGGITQGSIVLDSCKLQQRRVGVGYSINLAGGADDAHFKGIDCRYEPNASYTGGLSAGSYLVELIGGELIGFDIGFSGFANGITLRVDGLDFGAVTSLYSISTGTGYEAIDINIKNSLIPSGVTIPETNTPSQKALVTNCKTTAGSNAEHLRMFAGSTDSETTNVRTGGAEVEGVGYAYEMLPNTNVGIGTELQCPTITGSADFSTSKTIDIYIANTTRDLQDDEVYVRLSYPTYNQGGNTVVSSKSTNWLVAPATIADDTVSIWGGSPTYMQKISITAGGATEGREGPFEIEVLLAVDVDVLVDPDPVIS